MGEKERERVAFQHSGTSEVRENVMGGNFDNVISVGILFNMKVRLILMET